jgi:hypothetical protein
MTLIERAAQHIRLEQEPNRHGLSMVLDYNGKKTVLGVFHEEYAEKRLAEARAVLVEILQQHYRDLFREHAAGVAAFLKSIPPEAAISCRPATPPS